MIQIMEMTDMSHAVYVISPLIQEERREKVLVERLMRQCQQERRIATQLMHIRKEKDTIRNNRYNY